MATRKPFKRDSVGMARFALKRAQLMEKHNQSKRNKKAKVSAQKFLLSVIATRKGRPQGKF